MRKLFFFCGILIMILSGCTLPAGQTPTPDLIGTQVVLQMTRSPVVPPTSAPTLALPTIQPSTTVAPSTTPLASGTPEPTGTTTPTNTVTPTGTTTSTLTQVVPPTKTPSSDPRDSLGNPTWKDTFPNGQSWGLESPYDDGNTRVEITGDAMMLTSYSAKGWHGWRVSYLKPKNFYLEATITTKTCSTSDQYGLIFRSPDNASGYWYEITCDGRYALMTGDGGTFTEVLKFKAGSAIHAGSNQTNRFGVMVQDSTITLYGNGKKLDSVTDTTYPNAGTFGYFIAGYKTLNFTISSSEIDYWEF